MEDLIFVIPRIDSWDFGKFRDGKVELRHLRSKILGLPKDCLVTLSDIDERVAELERELARKKTLIFKDIPKTTTPAPPLPKPLTKTQNLKSYVN